jgi:hypothetical protein
MIYINGRKASKKDLQKLFEDVKKGAQKITAHFTRKGATAFKTYL